MNLQDERHDSSASQPEKVLLFSGHMIDRPDRAVARLPAAKAAAAGGRIAAALEALRAGPGDIAYAQGAAGGDILFGEACLARGIDLRLLLPLPEAEFIAASILPSAEGEDWRRRYLALRARLPRPPAILAAAEADDASPYARCNRWLLDSALAHGAERLHFICLWDGGAGDGDGGTADMIGEVRRRGGRIDWLDTRQL